MLRKQRCAKCGSTFYTAGDDEICQNCNPPKDAPKRRKAQAKKDAEAVAKVQAPVKADSPQTVDIKAVAKDASTG